ncbi:hypothetical protein WG66_007530, partial [Moniliophthora roreri]
MSRIVLEDAKGGLSSKTKWIRRFPKFASREGAVRVVEAIHQWRDSETG